MKERKEEKNLCPKKKVTQMGLKKGLRSDCSPGFSVSVRLRVECTLVMTGRSETARKQLSTLITAGMLITATLVWQFGRTVRLI